MIKIFTITYWKKIGMNMLYVHHHAISVVLLVFGGAFAGGIIYLFLFASPEIDTSSVKAVSVSLHADNMVKVLSWNKAKQEGSLLHLNLPSTAFYTPPIEP